MARKRSHAQLARMVLTQVKRLDREARQVRVLHCEHCGIWGKMRPADSARLHMVNGIVLGYVSFHVCHLCGGHMTTVDRTPRELQASELTSGEEDAEEQ